MIDCPSSYYACWSAPVGADSPSLVLALVVGRCIGSSAWAFFLETEIFLRFAGGAKEPSKVILSYDWLGEGFSSNSRFKELSIISCKSWEFFFGGVE